MKHAFLPLAILLVAACSPADNDASANGAANQVEPAAEAPTAAVPSLAGQWDVVAINGGPVQQAYAMDAEVGPDRFTIQSECVRIPFDYRQDGNGVTFTPAQGGGCGRVRTLDEDSVAKVVGGASMAIFGADGSTVDLSGSGGSLSMTRR